MFIDVMLNQMITARKYASCLLQNIVDVYNARDGWYFPCLFI